VGTWTGDFGKGIQKRTEEKLKRKENERIFNKKCENVKRRHDSFHELGQLERTSSEKGKRTMRRGGGI